MKYKLVALDLDGTLLDSNNCISKFTVDALKKLESIGVIIVIATGRSYTSLKPLIATLELGNPVICYNGAMIRNGKTDEIIMNSTVPDEVSREFIKISRSEKIHFQGFIRGEFHYENISKYSKGYQKLSGLEGTIVNFDDLEELNFTKCMFIGESDKLLELEKKINPVYGDRSYISFSKPTFLEVMNSGASKAKALSRVAKEYGINQSDIIAFGDGLNDLDMLEYAGKGVAMCNGYESLKNQFETTKYSNNQDGVAKFLLNLLHEEELNE